MRASLGRNPTAVVYDEALPWPAFPATSEREERARRVFDARAPSRDLTF